MLLSTLWTLTLNTVEVVRQNNQFCEASRLEKKRTLIVASMRLLSTSVQNVPTVASTDSLNRVDDVVLRVSNE